MKTIKIVLVLVLGCLLFRPASACVNTSQTTLDGSKANRRSAHSASYLRHSLDMDLKRRGAEMEERLRGGSDFTNRNDYAVALIFVGRNDEAIRLLGGLEQENPGNYATAANLGTAYELAGNNALALKWIREGIHRNPESHAGTEWVHVKILEAKLGQEKDPDYFRTHSVLGLQAKRIKEDTGLLTVEGKTLNAKQVADAIHYQLMERMQFVKTADPAVASLLFDYGVLEASIGTVENARGLLAMAMKFGYPENKVNPVYAQLDRAMRIRNIKDALLYGGIVVGFIAFIVYGLKRGWITVSRANCGRA